MTKTYDAPFVSHDAGSLTGALVFRPSAAVDRLPPMKSEPSPIAERAIEQHGILVRTLRDRGVSVTQLEPISESPTESLLADCALIFPKGAVITRPSGLERRVEIVAVERALAELGVPILGRIESPGLLDAGDVTVGGDRVIVGVPRTGAGLRPRSNELGRRQLEAFASANDMRVVELALASDTLRLRDVFNFVRSDTVVAAPERVDLVPVADLKTIEVVRGEEFAAGIIAFGEGRVIANLRFRESIKQLRAAKIDVEAIDLWEFGKAGVVPCQLVLAFKRG